MVSPPFLSSFWVYLLENSTYHLVTVLRKGLSLSPGSWLMGEEPAVESALTDQWFHTCPFADRWSFRGTSAAPWLSPPPGRLCGWASCILGKHWMGFCICDWPVSLLLGNLCHKSAHKYTKKKCSVYYTTQYTVYYKNPEYKWVTREHWKYA